MKSTKNILLLLLLVMLWNISAAQTTGSFQFDGQTRTYTLYVPSAWTPDKHYPFLLALHGLTQTGNSMMTFSDFNTYAEEYGFIVAYPDGLSNSWNVGFVPGITTDDVGFLSALIDTVNATYSINLNKVYATGFSNGGFMSYKLACELGNRIVAVASVAGTMTTASLTDCEPQRDIPVMHIHGTNDMVVFYNGGFGNVSVNQVLTHWRTANECPSTAVIENLPDLVAEGSTVQKQTWGPCTDSTEVLFYKITGGGHSWPGSVGTTGSGNTNRDISASYEIWKFVSRFQFPEVNTSLSLNSNEAISIYPNPVNGEFVTINLPSIPSDFLVEIFTTDGRKVKSEHFAAGTTTVAMQISGLPTGMYILNVKGLSASFSHRLILL